MELKITLPDDLAPQLAARAAASDLSPEAWLAETVRSALGAASPLPGMTMAEFDAFVAEGEADAAAGRVVPWEEVLEELLSSIHLQHRSQILGTDHLAKK